MKNKLFVAAIGFFCLAMLPLLSFSQKENSLKHIPVTDPSGTFQNAYISIDDFVVKDNQIMVLSTLHFSGSETGIFSEAPLTILSSTCDDISLLLGPAPAYISNSVFHIAGMPVTITRKHNDQQFNNTLCSLANMQANASAHVIVAKLKQLVRALI